DLPGVEYGRRAALAYRAAPGPAAQALRWLASRAPAHLARLDLAPAARELASFAAPPYGLVWLFKPDAWVLARRAGLPTASAVCDLDDLDDIRLRSVAELARVSESRPPELSGMSGRLRRAVYGVDCRRWE